MNRFTHTLKFTATCVAFSWASSPIYAQTVKIDGAWVRTAVQGQKGTGGFMKLTADQDLQLVSLTSPAAGLAEVHEMKMEGDVMKMRALPAGIALPAGKTIELKPGGLHVMLMDLKQALPIDSTVPMTLVFKDKAGKEVKMELKVPVALRAPGAGTGADTGAAAKEMDHSMHK